MKLVVFICLFLSYSLGQAKQVPIDIRQSKLEWHGQKVIADSDHSGIVKLKKGMINLNEKNQLTGGTLIIDMTSIEDTDLSGKWKTKLEQHLNSEDFFHTQKHPEASFKITKVEPTRSDVVKVTGNLTIRGITHPETFEVQVKTKHEKGKKYMLASGEVEFDRNKYGVSYNSETSLAKKLIKIAKDKVIRDKVKLNVQLQSEKL